MTDFLNEFYDQQGDQIKISGPQGSRFAKQIANDFNPIHNADSRRFCVPGDLLFAIALQQYGLHESMHFSFRELVKADSLLYFPKDFTREIQVINQREKIVLDLKVNGIAVNNSNQAEQLIKNYVAFSGHNFPHILVPLMQQNKVMINPLRPLVIYEQMSLQFDTLKFENLNIELGETKLSVNGKRGDAELHFVIDDNGSKIGSGVKILVLSGLREYEQASIDKMRDDYDRNSRQPV